MSKLQAGDVVFLNSGSPPLTVQHTEEYIREALNLESGECRVSWFNGVKMEQAFFKEVMLCKVVPQFAKEMNSCINDMKEHIVDKIDEYLSQKFDSNAEMLKRREVYNSEVEVMKREAKRIVEASELKERVEEFRKAKPSKLCERLYPELCKHE